MKKITAIILCTAMLLSACVCGASATDKNVVHWDYYGDNNGFHICEISGYLEIGETTVYPVTTEDGDRDTFAVYEFEVEESGCYLIDHRDTESLEIAEIYENGYAYGFEEGSMPDDDGEMIYYLEKGTALFRIEAYDDGSTVSIKPYDGERPALTYDADYYIESVEIENFEYYTTSYERFNGTYSFANPLEDGAKITVNFKNGTSEEVKTYQTDDGLYSSIQIPIGDDGYYFYSVYAYHQRDPETSKLYFILSIDELEHIKAEYTIVEKDIKTNLDHLGFLLKSTSASMESTISELFVMIKNLDFEAIADNADRFASSFSWCFKTYAQDIFAFVKYFVF